MNPLQLLSAETRPVARLVGDQVRKNKAAIQELEYQLRELLILGLAVPPQDLDMIRGSIEDVRVVLQFAIKKDFPSAQMAQSMMPRLGILTELLEEIEEFGVL